MFQAVPFVHPTVTRDPSDNALYLDYFYIDAARGIDLESGVVVDRARANAEMRDWTAYVRPQYDLEF